MHARGPLEREPETVDPIDGTIDAHNSDEERDEKSDWSD